MTYTLLISAVILLIVINMLFEHLRMKKIAIQRGKPNICKFARDFDYRVIDTKIIREVWNETQLWLGKFDGENFPIQSSDNFEKTYRIDEDDLDDIYWDVSDRLGISTENVEVNPFYERVHSVKDLVLFIHHQQKGNYA